MTKEKPSFKFYSVVKGRNPGIYDLWTLAEQQVNGYSGAVFKGYNDKQSAETCMRKGNIENPIYYISVPHNPALTTNSLEIVDDEVSINSATAMPASAQGIKTKSCQTANSSSNTNCENCYKLSQLVSKLNERLTTLEEKLSTPSEPLNESVTNAIHTQLASIEKSLLAKLEAKITTLSSRPVYKYADAASSPQQLLPNSPQVAPKLARSSTQKRPSAGVQFTPSKCLVITDLSKENAMKLNQDSIRSGINQHFGPTMIDIVNRYKFSTAHPKFLIQLADEAKIDNILENWDPSLFGGCQIRKTIAPKQDSHTAMIRGVPLDISEEQISEDVRTKYNITSVHRLRAHDNSVLRTVKIEFSSLNHLQTALQSGIVLSSASILLRVEMPYEKATPNNSGDNV